MAGQFGPGVLQQSMTLSQPVLLRFLLSLWPADASIEAGNAAALHGTAPGM